jgi:hypothetical protein
MTTNPAAAEGIGSGWPDPTEPGVPAWGLEDGYHWLASQDGGGARIGQWSPDSWSWIMRQTADCLCPREACHMDYLGPCSWCRRSE